MKLLSALRERSTNRVMQDRLVWQAASLLLAYPDDGLAGRLDAVDELLGHISGPPAALLQPARHPDPRYSLLVLPLPSLEPGPGAAGVTYIFAAKEHKLVQVNVLWSTTDKPGDADRTRMSAAGVQLADYFRALRWRPNAATMGVPLGPNGVVLFSGIDPHKAMVEVSLTGVSLRGGDGKVARAEGPVKLRVAYMAGLGAH